MVSTALKQMLALGIIVSDRVLPHDTHFRILYLGVQARSNLNNLGSRPLQGWNLRHKNEWNCIPEERYCEISERLRHSPLSLRNSPLGGESPIFKHAEIMYIHTIVFNVSIYIYIYGQRPSILNMGVLRVVVTICICMYIYIYWLYILKISPFNTK